MNPYDEDEIKRQSQVGMLRGQEPASDTMPIGGGKGDSYGDFMQMTKRFAPNPSGLDSLFGDEQFRNRFPKARIHKNDWVDLGDGSELIDSIRGFDRDAGTGEAWQVLTESDAIRGNAAKARGGVDPRAMMAADNSSLARILQELNATADGSQSPAEREAVLAMLQGGF